MDSEDILLSLKKIDSELNRIFKSRGWVHVLTESQEPNHLENVLGSALFHCTDLRLRVSRIVEIKKHREIA